MPANVHIVFVILFLAFVICLVLANWGRGWQR